MSRWSLALGCLAVVAAVAWLGNAGEEPEPSRWHEVMPGVLRSPGSPAGYALVADDAALLIDAPESADGLTAMGIRRIDRVLLTHHHRDTCRAARSFLKAGVPVLAPKASADWLTPTGVQRYWADALPLRNSRTACLVLPRGLDGVDCSLTDAVTLSWAGWTLRVLETPGHTRGHVAFTARKGEEGPVLVFAGDALAGPGTVWSPYTLDWDHWTDAGMAAAAGSLRKLAAQKPDLLLPAHGPVIQRNTVAALNRTVTTLEEVGFLKSFERFSKQRLGNAPDYAFLAKEQAGSNGSKPWSRVSEHLWLTGNTYVLTSKDSDAFLVIDPWGKRSVEQIAKLKQDRRLGAVEVVMFTHAHYDHFDGVYDLADRDRYEVWMLDQAAVPLAEPMRLRAPFLDARPIRFDRRPKEGEELSWREYRFRFHHLPGQSLFTMGVETTIDGKRCYLTGDNFFHQDLYSGTGGWMGLNRSFPMLYAGSAQKVLEAAPDWVLAEHGGAFTFDAEDFRRRVRWGEACAAAADAVCPGGRHRMDWDPHRVRCEPVHVVSKPGESVRAEVAVANPTDTPQTFRVILEGDGRLPDQTWELQVPAAGEQRKAFSLTMPADWPEGRYVFTLRAERDGVVDPADGFLVVDVRK